MARSSSVCQFYEQLSQKAGMAHEHAIRYAWHVGTMLGVAVPVEEGEAACEELPPSTGSYRSECLQTPAINGSFERRPDSLDPSDSAGPEKG
ncbi:MAG: hypothetical protein M3283_09775 [Actinomycetota bacterium]|nr:hypothetical protein [Actinomycetota bacterium]